MIEYEVTIAGDGISVIAARGRVTVITARRLKDLIAELVAGGSAKVVVDMGETTFLDSSGLGALIAGLKTARQAGGDLRIARPSEAVRMVLEMTNIDKVLQPRESVAEAFDA
ncbi:MAG: STAS domain-containing protein [Nocardioides sp.]